MEDILKECDINFIKNDDDEIYIETHSLANFLGIKKIRNSLLHKYYEFDKKLIQTQTKGGLQNIIYITEQGLKKYICSSRKPNSIILAKKLQIETSHKFEPLETSFIINIKKTFAGLKIYEQYYVDKYLIDLYIPKYNLCIEFDENHHKYNLENDKKRQKYITEKLKCNFLRINENDNIFDSINKILHFAKLF